MANSEAAVPAGAAPTPTATGPRTRPSRCRICAAGHRRQGTTWRHDRQPPHQRRQRHHRHHARRGGRYGDAYADGRTERAAESQHSRKSDGDIYQRGILQRSGRRQIRRVLCRVGTSDAAAQPPPLRPTRTPSRPSHRQQDHQALRELGTCESPSSPPTSASSSMATTRSPGLAARRAERARDPVARRLRHHRAPHRPGGEYFH